MARGKEDLRDNNANGNPWRAGWHQVCFSFTTALLYLGRSTKTLS
jgi:hypothetical protein